MSYKALDAEEIKLTWGTFRMVRHELCATAFGLNQIDFPACKVGPEHDEVQSGQEEVYVGPFETPERARWAVSVSGGTEPLWARSGREIFFRQTTGHLARRSVTEDPDLRLGPVERLFDARGFRADHYHRAYDVTPRGDRFIMVRRQGLVSELVLVANWFEELKAKVAQ